MAENPGLATSAWGHSPAATASVSHRTSSDAEAGGVPLAWMVLRLPPEIPDEEDGGVPLDDDVPDPVSPLGSSLQLVVNRSSE